MKLIFLGAAHEVTGSCYLINACNKNILVDCGMEQGADVFVNQKIPVNPADIDYIILTHAHIDHSGKIPMLYANGFKGEIYATAPTVELCGIMLKDSAHIQESEAKWKNRKAKRAGKEEIVPLYTVSDATAVMEKFVPCDYGKKIEISDSISIRFTDAGHLLGSSSVEIWMREEETKKIVFSGDIGNINKPILKDPEYIDNADYAVMESTYGDRLHEEAPDYVKTLTDVLQSTFDRGGNVVIPSFAVGRTQELLYFIREIKEKALIKGHEGFEVYVDSPLAAEATNVFRENSAFSCDDETAALLMRGINPISFDGLKLSVTSEESQLINFDKKPKVIISASGMCEAGRIRHHLKHNLWRADSTILFVGYQSQGTLGRALLNGEKTVRLFGEKIIVKARIETVAGISGHADEKGLRRWIASISPKPKRVFVVHGDELVCDSFCEKLKKEEGYDAVAPYNGEIWDLLKNEKIAEGTKERVERKSLANDEVYSKLKSAGERLVEMIEKSRNAPKSELGSFYGELVNLLRKWER